MGLLYGSLGVFVTLIIVLYLLISPIFCAWLASQKGYSTGAWFGLGLFFGIFALLAIGFAPVKTAKAKENEIEFERQRIASEKEKEEQEAEAQRLKAEFANIAKFRVTKEVALQPQPDINSGIVDWLNIDETVICLEATVNKNEEWAKIRTEKGKEGWCHKDAVAEA
ncbi:MAG: SH3 domain-containing protein [Spirochaetaceae bacterium]|jgi:hypothetical protein|nr:SH3 domain-containing protein [Spirochaetaceae bacterium]